MSEAIDMQNEEIVAIKRGWRTGLVDNLRRPLTQSIIGVVAIALAILFWAFPREPNVGVSLDERAQLRATWDLTEDQTDTAIAALESIRGGASFEDAKAALLKGETARAKGVLSQIVENRRADRTSATADVAEALRNLGSITMLDEPAQAVLHFEEATQLEPERFNAWLGLGNAGLRNANTTLAARAFERAAEIAEAATSPNDVDESPREVALQLAYTNLAVIAAAEDQFEEAEAFHTQALEAARARDTAIRTNHSAANVAGASGHFAELLIFLDRYDEARELVESAISILEDLRAKESSNGRYRLDLATSRGMMARLLESSDPQRAELLYRQSVRGLELLHEQNADHIDVSRGLAIVSERFGFWRQQRGEYEEAEALFARGLTLTTRIAGRFPNDAKAHDDMATSLDRMGDLYQRTARLQEASAVLLQSVTVRNPSLASSPDNGQLMNNMAVAECRLGGVLNRRGMFRDAEQHLDRCIQLREQLAERDQRRQRMLPFLALSYLDMVGAQVGSERLYEANQTASLLRNVLSESDPSGGGRSTRAILGRDLAFWSCRREAYWVPSESKLILAVPTDPSPSNDESP